MSMTMMTSARRMSPLQALTAVLALTVALNSCITGGGAEHLKPVDGRDPKERESKCDVEPLLLCNGVRDCEDGSDEDAAMCQSLDCPALGLGKCPGSFQCVPSFAMCDGAKDCSDGSDEGLAFCQAFDCSSIGLETCKSGAQCFSSLGYCDGQKDCADGTDEAPAFCATFNCSTADPSSVSCPEAAGQRKQCIPEFSLCNGNVQCDSGSDENATFCAAYACPEGTIKCQNTNVCTYGAFCDGNDDCAGLNFDDSVDLSKLVSDEDDAVCKDFVCPAGYKKCKGSTLCFVESEECDAPSAGVAGKAESSVESSCTEPDFVPCPDAPEECIPLYSLCNGNVQCSTKSDEADWFCADYACPEGLIKCPGTNTCILGSYCNGVDECASLNFNTEEEAARATSDEDAAFCTAYVCPEGLTKCTDGVRCFATEGDCEAGSESVSGSGSEESGDGGASPDDVGSLGTGKSGRVWAGRVGMESRKMLGQN